MMKRKRRKKRDASQQADLVLRKIRRNIGIAWRRTEEMKLIILRAKR